MATKVYYKDGSSEILTDEEFLNFPKEMESEIKKAEEYIKPKPQEIIPEKEPTYLGELSQMYFPRLSQADKPDYSQGITQGLRTEGGNIVEGLKDAASIPGKALMAGLMAGLGSVDGGRQGAYSGFQEAFDTTPKEGLAGILQSVGQSPYNIIPGVGSIGQKSLSVIGKYAPKLAEGIGKIVENPLARGAGTVLGEGAVNVGIGQLEGSEDPLRDAILGAIGGSIPGAYQFNKGKNVERLGQEIITGGNFGKTPKATSIGTDQIQQAKKLNEYLVSQGLSTELPKDSRSLLQQHFEKDRPIFEKYAEQVTNPASTFNQETGELIFTRPKVDQDFKNAHDLVYGQAERLRSYDVPKSAVGKELSMGDVAKEVVMSGMTGVPGISTGFRVAAKPDLVERVVERNPLFTGLAGIIGRSLYRPKSDR